MEHNSVIMSYLVRCTLEANGCFRVFTRNITSGEERHFSSLEDAVTYIQRQMREAKNVIE